MLSSGRSRRQRERGSKNGRGSEACEIHIALSINEFANWLPSFYLGKRRGDRSPRYHAVLWNGHEVERMRRVQVLAHAHGEVDG